MVWEWSHSAEAYDALRQVLPEQPREWLETVYAEWKASPRGHFHPQPTGILGGGDFDERRYERSRSAARFIDTDALAAKILEWAEKASNCSNGGWEAYCCPYGCGPHGLPWGRPENE